MTRDDVIRMAREAPLVIDSGVNECIWKFNVARLERFSQLVVENFLKQSGQYLTNDASREAAIAEAVAAERQKHQAHSDLLLRNAVLMEREACAKVCEVQLETGAHIRCAAAIRARGAA